MTTLPQQALAGVRGAAWGYDPLPSTVETRIFPVALDEGASTYAVLYSSLSSRTAIFCMHPREFLPTHYLAPVLIDAGVSVWLQAPRSVGVDIRLEHEIALKDVAAGIRRLKAEGFERIILLGNSGGASLLCLYQEQALTAREQRISRTPGGRPTGLREEVMPPADGVVLVAPHPGQGRLLMASIDPSVIDEADPFSTNPTLDPFSPRNGFRRPPQSSSYTAEFVKDYRSAQRERVARLDEVARQLIAQRLEARQTAKDTPADLDALKRGTHTGVMTIWRTDADLRNWDLSIEPTERKVGSLWGPDPLASNLGTIGFARFCTPESWLSTWSGLSSNADLSRTIRAIDVPLLLISFAADASVFPSDFEAIFEAAPAKHKILKTLPGNHHGLASGAAGVAGRTEAGNVIREWLNVHFV